MIINKLSNEELTEVLKEKVKEMNPQLIMQMLEKIMDDLTECNGPGFEKKFPREEIMAAILLEMYKKGFVSALVLFNEAIGDITQKSNVIN